MNEAPLSPCTGVCDVRPDTGLCSGCLRTIGEITIWRDLTNAQRRAIMDRLPERAPHRD